MNQEQAINFMRGLREEKTEEAKRIKADARELNLRIAYMVEENEKKTVKEKTRTRGQIGPVIRGARTFAR